MFDLDLPIHPFTGVQAIGRLKNGTPVYPVMGGAPDDGDDDGDDGSDDGDAGGQGSGQQGGQSSGDGDRGFPANTPIKDMTAEQQAAYWKFHDRRKSDRLDAFDGITPEQAKEWREAADKARRDGMQPDERAIEDAVTAAKSDATNTAAATFAPQIAEAVIERFVDDEEQRQQLLGLIDPMKFMKDGVFDKGALVTTLTGLSTAFGGNGSGNGNPPSQWGQFSSRPPATKRSEEGRAEARRRGFIKD